MGTITMVDGSHRWREIGRDDSMTRHFAERERTDLERVLAEKGLTDPAQLARTRDAWEHACARTPHGEPIALRPDDFRG